MFTPENGGLLQWFMKISIEILTEEKIFVKVIRQSKFHEGVVRVYDERRDLSTDSAMTYEVHKSTWQILKNETHVCFSDH